MYESGQGVIQDDTKAFQWYSKAAAQGFAEAQYNLGTMYYNGRSVPQDYKKAFEWYSKAAEQGDADAQNDLGVMYFNGLATPQNTKEATKWITKAANQGHALAKSNLEVLSSKEKYSSKIFSKLLQLFQPEKETLYDANVRQISSFEDARSVLENLPSDALVIFDLDETLVVNRDKNLLTALTEPFTPNLIKNLQKKGIKTIALTNSMTFITQQDSSQEEWRHKELLEVGIDFSKSFQEFFIFNNLPIYEGHYPILSKGIIYTNRIPKGEVLAAFLEKMKDTLKPTIIIFFDDKPENILDVKKASEERNTKYIGFVYNKITRWLDDGMSYEDIQKKLLLPEKITSSN